MNECESKKDNEKCVCVNIFVKCDKKEKDACEGESWEKKDYMKDDCCVCVNVFAECKKDEYRKEDWKKDDCCVEVNIFAECNKKN